MSERVMTGAESGEKPLAPVLQMKVGKTANWVRDYGARVLSERASGVINPNDAEMSAIVNDLRS